MLVKTFRENKLSIISSSETWMTGSWDKSAYSQESYGPTDFEPDPTINEGVAL